MDGSGDTRATWPRLYASSWLERWKWAGSLLGVGIRFHSRDRTFCFSYVQKLLFLTCEYRWKWSFWHLQDDISAADPFVIERRAALMLLCSFEYETLHVVPFVAHIIIHTLFLKEQKWMNWRCFEGMFAWSIGLLACQDNCIGCWYYIYNPLFSLIHRSRAAASETKVREKDVRLSSQTNWFTSGLILDLRGTCHNGQATQHRSDKWGQTY